VYEKKYPLKKVAENVAVPFNQAEEKITLWEIPLPGSSAPVYLIDNYKYLGQNGVYFEKDASSSGSTREAERFTFLARSSLAIFEPLGWYPDIVHCHDWHVGMVPVITKILGKNNKKLQKIKTVLTIHNLEYQGKYQAAEILKILGFKESDYPTLSEQANGEIVSVQQAILNSDFINAVSPTYAQEILTPEYGAGLESTLQKRKDKLIGILNGIDVEKFNPATDTEIMANYTAQDLFGKAKCKEDLQKTCNLPVDKNLPILGIVSRLADQKGIDLIYNIADELAKENLQFVLLGTGDPKLEALMQEMTKKYPQKMYAKIAFDAHFAQQIYAGADIFLMPSRFEPCGLGQMIAMRYGTLPIVRATGGLKDTVADYNPETEEGDGFVFQKYDSREFLEATKRALSLYQNQEKWYKVVRGVMQRDFSWRQSAREYIKLYHKVLI